MPELRAAGHGTHPLTLSGLADKRGVPAGQHTDVQDIVAEVQRNDLRDVILVGHSYSGIPTGQAAQRIGERLTRVVFVDSNVPTHGESFMSAASPGGQAMLAASIAANAGFWPPLTAADFDGQGLTSEQIARIVDGSTPHPGATLTEPAVLARPLGELPATYIKCLLDGAEPMDAVAELMTSERRRLVEMDTGHGRCSPSRTSWHGSCCTSPRRNPRTHPGSSPITTGNAAHITNEAFAQQTAKAKRTAYPYGMCDADHANRSRRPR